MLFLDTLSKRVGARSEKTTATHGAQRTRKVVAGLAFAIVALMGAAPSTANAQAQDTVAISVSQSTVTGGAGTAFTVTITPGQLNANCTGAVVSNNAAIVVGSATTANPGKGTRTFNLTAPNVVATDTVVTLTGDFGNANTQSINVTVKGLISSVSLNPTTVISGASSTGTVTLNAAPSTNKVINLSYGTGASGPATVTVNAGNTSANFTVNTSVTSTSKVAAVTASFTSGGTSSVSTNLNITGITISNITSSKGTNPTIAGGVGNSFTVTVTPSDSSVSTSITLSSPDGRVKVGGSSSQSLSANGARAYTITAPEDVSVQQGITLTATLDTNTATIPVVVMPFVTGVTLSSNSIFGGTTITGSVQISENPTIAQTVALSANNASVTPDSTVNIATNGANSFNVATSSSVPSVSSCNIVASHTATGTSSSFTSFELGPIPTATITSTKRYILGGDTATLTITLSSKVMTNDYNVTFTNPNTTLLDTPASFTVAKDSTSFQVNVQTHEPEFPSTNTVRLGITALSTEIAAYSFKIGKIGIKSIVLDDSSLFEGDSTNATVSITFPAQGDLVIPVTSSATSRVPSFTVTILDGETSGSATVNTVNNHISADGLVNLTAATNNTAKKATFTIKPLVTSLSINPTSVMGGENVTFTVTLGKASASDETFTLTGNGFNWAPITVQAGQLTGSVVIPAKTVTSIKNFTITATGMGGYIRKATVTVNPNS